MSTKTCVTGNNMVLHKALMNWTNILLNEDMLSLCMYERLHIRHDNFNHLEILNAVCSNYKHNIQILILYKYWYYCVHPRNYSLDVWYGHTVPRTFLKTTFTNFLGNNNCQITEHNSLNFKINNSHNILSEMFNIPFDKFNTWTGQ